MKLMSLPFRFRLAAAGVFAAALTTFAQPQSPATTEPAQQPATSSQPAPADSARPPLDAPAPSPSPSAAGPEAAPAAKTENAEPPLRDISNPDATGPVEAPAPSRANRPHRSNPESDGQTGDSVPFGDHTVTAGSRAGEAVSIFGSTLVQGEVVSDVVAILGNARITESGRAGGAAVAILGELEVDGPVGGETVSVVGSSRINAAVKGEAVAVLGNLELGPKAIVEGDVVVVGGTLKRHPNAVVRGNVVNVPLLGGLGDFEWLVTYFKRCVLLGRPLAFGQHLGWAWLVAASFLAFYLLLALLFPRPMLKCIGTLETRPGYSVLASVLTVFLTPVVIVLLVATVVGAVVVPFLGIGLFVAGLFGKAVILGWLGRRFTRFFGDGPLSGPVFAVFVGGVLVTLLYTVPVLGFMLWKLTSWLGTGVVVYTIVLAMSRDKPPATIASGVTADSIDSADTSTAAGTGSVPVSAASAAGETVSRVAMTTAAGSGTMATPAGGPGEASLASAGFVGGSPSISAAPAAVDVTSQATTIPPTFTAPSTGTGPASSGATTPPPIFVPAGTPPLVTPPRPQPVVSAATLPRAGFLIRMAALLLDLILVGLVTAFISGLLPRALEPEPPAVLLLLAVYGAVMWKLRGTTIGGIICGLKVVRVDDRAIDWPTAVVRALSCFLSLVVAGLGFIWVAIDRDRQSWHDKIAGTTVVRVPKGVSLL
jgi:uncharacterized RDD family membrane protein YckC